MLFKWHKYVVWCAFFIITTDDRDCDDPRTFGLFGTLGGVDLQLTFGASLAVGLHLLEACLSVRSGSDAASFSAVCLPATPAPAPPTPACSWKRKSCTQSPRRRKGVWFKQLKFNKYCSTFVLFDKKFLILN
jgi:hypothetical protein